MEINLTLEQKSTALHIIAGVIIGALSGFMSKDPFQIPNNGILLLMVGILAILYFISQKFFNLRAQETAEKKYGVKWYLSNGVYPYMIFWLVAWIAMYNF